MQGEVAQEQLCHVHSWDKFLTHEDQICSLSLVDSF